MTRPDLDAFVRTALWGAQVKRRLIVAPPSFVIKVVDKGGVRTVRTILPDTVT